MATGTAKGQPGAPPGTSASKSNRASRSKTAAPADTTPDGNPSTAADEVDAQLARYRSMRDFAITDEPSGDGRAGPGKSKPASKPAPRRSKVSAGLPFVIQKHAASHLHYDF